MTRFNTRRRLNMLGAGVSFTTIVLCGLPSSASAQSAASPYTTGFRWDAERRLVGTISPDPDGAGPLLFPAVRYSFDGEGKLTTVEKGTLASWQADTVLPANWSGFSALETTSYAYDAVGNKVEERLTTAAGSGAIQRVTQASYDPDDRPSCTAVRMNLSALPATGSDACALGTVSASFGADRIERNFYDEADQPTQIKRAVGTSLEQAYSTFTYTGNGKREQVIDANGNRAKLVYDGFDRQSQWQFPQIARAAFDGSTPATALATAGAVNAADYEQYGYDAAGSRTSLKKRGGELLGYGYDALGRMSRKDAPATTSAAAYSVNYGYDLLNRQTSATFAATGLGTSNAFDNADRLISTTNSSGGTARLLGYQYDANGNRKQVTHPDGAYFTYGYDGLNRAISIAESGGTVLASIAYDDLGRRLSLSRGGGSTNTTYGYDAASRLSSLTHDLAGTSADVSYGFSYNPANQIVSRSLSNDAYAFTEGTNGQRSYASDGLNRYAVAGSASPTYDGDGNVTGNGLNTTFGYDAENRLVSASGLRSASLQYDPTGRLLRTSGSIAGGRELLYDGDALIAEYDDTGHIVQRYVHGPGVDEPVTWYDGGSVTSASRRSLVADAQGSVVAVADAAGNPVAINRYDPWGLPSGDNKGRFLYTGQIIVPELGMYHYKARVYSAKLGRFLQTDPVGYNDQVNLYAYVANDPVDGRDPTGLYDCSKADCPNVTRYATELKGYVDALKGSKNLDRSQMNDLKRGTALLGFLGTQNDHNGVTISNNSSLSPTTGGQTSLDENGQVRIELNFGAINARESLGTGIGGSVLAHELVHGFEDKYKGNIQNYGERLQRERNAYSFQFNYERYFGLRDPRSVGEAAAQSCDSAMGEDFAANGRATQGGHCR